MQLLGEEIDVHYESKLPKGMLSMFQKSDGRLFPRSFSAGGMVVILLFALASQLHADSVPWLRNFEQASQASRQTGRPMLVHFYSNNCPPCKQLDIRAFEDRELLQSMSDQVIPVKINVDENRDIADRYQVTRWPTDVYLFPNGSELYRTVSPQDPAVYRQMIDRVALRNRDWVIEQNSRFAATEKHKANQLARTTAYNAAESDLPLPQTKPAEFAANQFNQSPTPATLTNYPVSHSTAQERSNGNARSSTSSRRSDSKRSADEANQQHAGRDGSTGSHVASATDVVAEQTEAPINRYRGLSQPRRGGMNSVANPYVYEGQPGNQPSAQPPAMASSDPTVAPAPSLSQDGMGSSSMPSLTPPRSLSPPSSLVSAPNSIVSNSQATLQNAQPAVEETPRFGESSAVVFDGCCPIALASNPPAWRLGSASFAVRHRGRIYHCESDEARAQFLADPDRYSPVFSGYDIVRFMKFGEIVEGNRQFGCWFNKRIYLFANRETYQEFVAIKEKISADFDQLQNGGRVAEGAAPTVQR